MQIEILKYNIRYGKSKDGQIWHKSYNGGWHVVEPYRFANGKMVVRLYHKGGGMSVYTVESILAGAPKPP